MFGMMCMSDDGEIVVMIVPDPDDTSRLLMIVKLGSMSTPPIPVPVGDLHKVLEQVYGK